MSGRPDALRQIRYFTDRGYAWVAQDRRGTGASFGVEAGFVNEFDAKDAKAVIEWAGAQSFSNERVVALGPAELVFDFFPISYVFKQGHRIRVSLSTSIGEAYQTPPLADGKPITLTLYRNSNRTSAIELPVVSGP